MKKFTALKGLSSIIIKTFIVVAFAQNAFAETEFEKSAKEMLDFARQRDIEKSREEMRDKTHDGRIRTGDNSSIGIGDKGGINFRKVFLIEKRF